MIIRANCVRYVITLDGFGHSDIWFCSNFSIQVLRINMCYGVLGLVWIYGEL